MQTVYMNALQAMKETREGRTFYNQEGKFLLRGDDTAIIVTDNYLPDEGIFGSDSPEAQQCRHRRLIQLGLKARTDEFTAWMA